MIKLPKDARQSVRYNSDLYAKLQSAGWTIQSLLDWAIAQNSGMTLKTTISKPPKATKKRAT